MMSTGTPLRPSAPTRQDDVPGERVPLPGTDLTLRVVPASAMTTAQLHEALELLRGAFNGGPSWFARSADPIDHLHWKSVDRPGGAVFELTELGDQLIGMTLRGYQRFILRGAQVLSDQGFDAARDLEYQGRGLSTIRRALRENGQISDSGAFALGFGTHPTSGARRGRQYSTPLANRIETFVRPLSAKNLLLRRRRSAPPGPSRTRESMEARVPGMAPPKWTRARLVSAARLAASLAVRSPRQRANPWTIETIRRFDARADDLSSSVAGQFDLIQVRDAEYLNWRFMDPRAGSYLVRAAEQEGELLGYVVLDMGKTSGALVDVLVMPGRTDVLRSLLQDASLIARARGLSHLRTWCAQRHIYRRTLEACGFVEYPSVMTAGLRANGSSGDCEELAQDPNARVHITIADSDHM